MLLLAENIVSHRIDIKVSFDSSSPAPDERDEGREEWSVHSIAPYSTTNIARSILIVTEAGRTFASIQLRIPERTVLKFFQARTILADGTIIPAKLPESALRPGEDGSRTLALALPNAKPGSIVQYIYQLEEAGFSRAARLTLPAALPVRRARLTLRSYDFIKVKKQADDVFDLRPAIASEGQRKFSWQASDVSAKKTPLRASWHVTRIDTSSRNTNAGGD